MSERRFSRKCAKCRQRTMEVAVVPYTISIDHDGRKYSVHLPVLTVPRCANCGAIRIDDEADRQISDAFHRTAGLLTAEQIRSNRQALRLNQQELADLLGVAVSTLSRWETGAQIQQRAMDRLLRAFFSVPELRTYLDQCVPQQSIK